MSGSFLPLGFLHPWLEVTVHGAYEQFLTAS